MIETVLLRRPLGNQFADGCLHDLHRELLRRSGVHLLEFQDSWPPMPVRRFTTVGTRYERLIGVVPKPDIWIDCHVLIVPLMSAHSFPLWYRRLRTPGGCRKVLYLLDTFTLDAQLGTIAKLAKCVEWDHLVTSFSDAIPYLEARTGRRWHCVPQGVALDRFQPLAPTVQPAIAFSSYGRRMDFLHEALKAFCKKRGLYYDFSISDSLSSRTTADEGYESYAWHLRQSWFNICWPVELTNPTRAGSIRPVTCRWFEAASCGAVVIGAPPRNSEFHSLFGPDFVETIDPDNENEDLDARLDTLWENRVMLRTRRLELASQFRSSWSWADRVNQLLEISSQPGTS